MRLLNCSVIMSLIFSACLCDALLKIPDDVRASLEGQEVLETRKSLPHGQQEDRYNAIRERILESKRIPPQVKLFAENLLPMDLFVDYINIMLKSCSASEMLSPGEVEKVKDEAKSFFRRVLNDGSELGESLFEKAIYLIDNGEYIRAANTLLHTSSWYDSIKDQICVSYSSNAEELLSVIVHETAHGLECCYYKSLNNGAAGSKSMLSELESKPHEYVSIFFEQFCNNAMLPPRVVGLYGTLYSVFLRDRIAEVVDETEVEHLNDENFAGRISPIFDMYEKDLMELDVLFSMMLDREVAKQHGKPQDLDTHLKSFKRFIECTEKTEGYEEEAKSFLRDLKAGKLTKTYFSEYSTLIVEALDKKYEFKVPAELLDDTECLGSVLSFISGTIDSCMLQQARTQTRENYLKNYEKFKEYTKKIEGNEAAEVFFRDFEAGKLTRIEAESIVGSGTSEPGTFSLKTLDKKYEFKVPAELLDDKECLYSTDFFIRVDNSRWGLSCLDPDFRRDADDVIDFCQGKSKVDKSFILNSHDVGFYNAFHFMRTDRVREIIEAGDPLPVEYIFHALTTEEEHIPVTEENVQEFYDYLKGKVSSE